MANAYKNTFETLARKVSTAIALVQNQKIHQKNYIRYALGSGG
jgi:hypothetical protein